MVTLGWAVGSGGGGSGRGGISPLYGPNGWSWELSQGATADLAVSQPYTMAVAGRGRLVVPGSPTSLAAPFLTAVHVLISGHVQSRPPASGRSREPLPWSALTSSLA